MSVRESDKKEYRYILDVLATDDERRFLELAELVDGFPDGIDGWFGRRWIRNAVDCGSYSAIAWMLEHKVDLSFQDDDGYTVLHAALERWLPDRYRILSLLLEHGASVKAHGNNDWTPAHMAAFHQDIEALQLLIKHGADLSIRTRIDDYATPLEDARIGEKTSSILFLEGLEKNS